MKSVLALIVVSLLIGCSNPVESDTCETVGAVDNISVDYHNDGIDVHYFESVATSGDLYFYLDERFAYEKQLICPIPDKTLYVDSKVYNNISALIDQDAAGRWYMQIIRNGTNLCMSVGASIEIKSFSVRW